MAPAGAVSTVLPSEKGKERSAYSHEMDNNFIFIKPMASGFAVVLIRYSFSIGIVLEKFPF